VASTRTTAVVSVMLAALTVSFLLLGIGDAGTHSELVKVGGWFRARRQRGRPVRRVRRRDQRHVHAHPPPAGPARARPDDRMTRRGPAHQPIAGWREAVRTATLAGDGPV
jgi:hypothetical protein